MAVTEPIAKHRTRLQNPNDQQSFAVTSQRVAVQDLDALLHGTAFATLPRYAMFAAFIFSKQIPN